MLPVRSFFSLVIKKKSAIGVISNSCNMHGGEELIFQRLVCTDAHESVFPRNRLDKELLRWFTGWMDSSRVARFSQHVPAQSFPLSRQQTDNHNISGFPTSVAFLSHKVFPTQMMIALWQSVNGRLGAASEQWMHCRGFCILFSMKYILYSFCF